MKNICAMKITIIRCRSIFITLKPGSLSYFFFSIDFLSTRVSEVNVRMPLWLPLTITRKLVHY